MNAYSTAAILLLGGVLQAESWLNEYALILSDAPVARASHLSSRIASAQRRVADELSRRNIPTTGSARTLVNAIFVRASEERLAELRSIPGVARVQYLPPVHRKLDHALDLVHASAAWAALGGGRNAGAGVKIGILDTGIDQNHPAFQDSSLTPPKGFPKGDANYTNGKVIVARSYVAMLPFKLVDATDSRPDDVTPRDRSGHGTAIAMIAAGEQVSAPLATITGIAPKAYLGNYKIFGSPGVNDTTRSPVIIQALEDAISDGMDVVVLPVGDPAGYGALLEDSSCAGDSPGFNIPADACDVRTQAVENAVRLGLTVVVPAGNDGGSGVNFPTLASIDTPGTAPSAITVGATANTHWLYSGVIVPGKDAPTRLLYALFGDGPKLQAPLSAPVRDVSQLQDDGRACSALLTNSLKGAIALVQRGDCTFTIKVINAENAGALAVVIVEGSGDENPFPPTGLALTGIPAVIVGNSNGGLLQNFARNMSGQHVIIDPAVHPVDSAPDVVASFSSRGPAISTGAIKPELVAPGADLYTAAQSYDPNGDVYDPSGFTGVSGTSFSAALVAGAAALVKQAHPSFTPGQIKSALVDRAAAQVLDNGATAGITAAGAGKLDAGAVVATAVTVEPATVSFGVIGSKTQQLRVPLALTNVTKAPVSLSIAVQPSVQGSSANVTVSSSSLQLPPGSSQLIAQLQNNTPQPGSYEGFILIHGGGVNLRVPYLYLVGDGVADNVLPIEGASFDGSVNDQGFLLVFKVIDRFGVAVTGEPVLFNVAAGDGVITASDAATDILGVAAAQVDMGSQAGDQIFTADAAAFHLEFDGLARLRPTIQASGVVNAASHLAGKGLAPGSYGEIVGSGLSEVTSVASTPTLPVSLAGVSVSFDAPGLSVPGRLVLVSPGKVTVQIPWELQGLNSVNMKVNVGDSQSAFYTMPLASASPAAFEALDSSGNRLVIWARDSNHRIVSSANAARRNSTIILYVNGLGAVDHPPPSGTPTPRQPIANTSSKPKVSIGGVDAPVSLSGLLPDAVALYQIQLTVPAQAPKGLQPVVIAINGIDSKPANLPVQ